MSLGFIVIDTFFCLFIRWCFIIPSYLSDLCPISCYATHCFKFQLLLSQVDILFGFIKLAWVFFIVFCSMFIFPGLGLSSLSSFYILDLLILISEILEVWCFCLGALFFSVWWYLTVRHSFVFGMLGLLWLAYLVALPVQNHFRLNLCFRFLPFLKIRKN